MRRVGKAFLKHPLTRLGPLVGLVISLLALGLLFSALQSPAATPRFGVVPWAQVGRILFLLFLLVLSAGLAGLTWLLLRGAFRSLGRPRGQDHDPPHVREEHRTPPILYLIPIGFLACLAGLFAWFVSHRGPSQPPTSFLLGAEAGSPFPGAGPETGDPLIVAASGLLGVALVVAWLASVAALVVALVGRSVPVVVAAQPRPLKRGTSSPAGPGPAPRDPPSMTWDYSDPQVSVLRAYQAFIRVMAAAGVASAGRTARELRGFAVSRFPDAAAAIFDLTSVYERCRYGPRPATLSELLTARDAYIAITTYLGRTVGGGTKSA